MTLCKLVPFACVVCLMAETVMHSVYSVSGLFAHVLDGAVACWT